MKTRGFTLIELLVVIAIIGLLSSVVLAALNQARISGRDARRQTDAKQIVNALELYATANGGTYPVTPTVASTCGTSIFDCAGGLATPLAPYLSEIPSDPNPTFVGTYQNYRYAACTTTNPRYYNLLIRVESVTPNVWCVVQHGAKGVAGVGGVGASACYLGGSYNPC